MKQVSSALKPLLLATCAVTATQVWSHGSLTQPPSRNWLCATAGGALNANCGSVQYEPQSLEAPSGWPQGGPPDGRIASANLGQFAPLDEQTSSRWTKRPISAGDQTFEWRLTAFHATRNWRYYITKQDWNPNVKLGRASFEETPFCVIDGGQRQPLQTVRHNCNVPNRSGYQLILAVWEISNTPNSFYNMADVQFQGHAGSMTTPAPSPIAALVSRGTINPSIDLKVGDSVSTRVFDANGENPSLQTRLTIASDADGLRNSWPFLLATQINTDQPLLHAGQLGSNGSVSPVQGRNEIYSRSNSGVRRVETQINKAALQPAAVEFSVTNFNQQITVSGGRATVSFGVTGVDQIDVNATVFDATGQTRGAVNANLNNASQTLNIVIHNAIEGLYQLVVKSTVTATGAVTQKTFQLTLTGGATPPLTASAFEFRFPDGLSSYKAGTQVLQPKDGQVYECKPFPFNGFCVQWTAGSNAYEPGVGSAWERAWIRR